MKKIDGAWAMVICAIGWSLAGVFMKYVNINSFAMAGFRSVFAFITIAALTRHLPRFVIKTETGETDKKSTLYLWLAALNYAATMILFCLCNKLTYSANAVLPEICMRTTTDLAAGILSGGELLLSLLLNFH